MINIYQVKCFQGFRYFISVLLSTNVSEIVKLSLQLNQLFHHTLLHVNVPRRNSNGHLILVSYLPELPVCILIHDVFLLLAMMSEIVDTHATCCRRHKKRLQNRISWTHMHGIGGKRNDCKTIDIRAWLA